MGRNYSISLVKKIGFFCLKCPETQGENQKTREIQHFFQKLNFPPVLKNTCKILKSKIFNSLQFAAILMSWNFTGELGKAGDLLGRAFPGSPSTLYLPYARISTLWCDTSLSKTLTSYLNMRGQEDQGLLLKNSSQYIKSAYLPIFRESSIFFDVNLKYSNICIKNTPCCYPLPFVMSRILLTRLI